MNEIAVRENNPNDVEMNKHEILNIIDQLPFRSNVTFTGGEIFLKKGIEEIIKKTAEKHRVAIATNGLLLSKHAEMVLNAGVKAIGVSMDGPPEVHDRVRNVRNAFQQLENSLIKIVEYKESNQSKTPKITVNSVILKDNYSRLFEVVEIVKNIGIKSCSFQIIDLSLNRSGIALNETIHFSKNPLKNIEKIDPIHLRQSLLKIMEEGEKNGIDIKFSPQLTIDEIVQYYQGTFNRYNWECLMPWNTMRISPYGDVYPCMNLYIGNVRENKLNKLWNASSYIQFRQSLKRSSLFPSCIGCCKKHPKNSN
jgi:radical SAM protein with 4Fe4S-binding SPASM domain